MKIYSLLMGTRPFGPLPNWPSKNQPPPPPPQKKKNKKTRPWANQPQVKNKCNAIRVLLWHLICIT